MPYRADFRCLWCGAAWTTRGADDLEGWAQLCPACLGRAGSNRFLRARLREALAERAAHRAPEPAPPGPITPTGHAGSGPTRTDVGADTTPGRAGPGSATGRRSGARPAVAFPDDWFLRRGPFERGALHDAAWAAELDVVTRWLDAQPLGGRIAEPAAGVGFFSPLLAERGELHASDADGGALDLARSRLVAHHLLAHLHAADPWAYPAEGDKPFDALVAAFLLGRVRRAGLDLAADLFRARLRSGGALAVVDLRPDPAGGPPPGAAWTYHDPAEAGAALARAGFTAISVSHTGRFFLTLSATAP